MEYFWTVFKIEVVSKHMFRVFIVKTDFFLIYIFFECMEIAETIYEDAVEPSY